MAGARIPLTLGHLGQADQDHDLDQRSMNAALWQVGWGYFLTNMIGAETGLSMASVDGRAAISSPMSAPAGRCRRCASAASPMAFCRSPPLTSGRPPPPRTTPRRKLG
jgi:hypothetical protein